MTKLVVIAVFSSSFPQAPFFFNLKKKANKYGTRQKEKHRARALFSNSNH